MLDKKVLVAIDKDKNGKCLRVSKVVNVNQKDYAKFVNEQNEEIEKQAQEKAELLETIKTLEQDISLLKNEIRMLKGEENDE